MMDENLYSHNETLRDTQIQHDIPKIQIHLPSDEISSNSSRKSSNLSAASGTYKFASYSHEDDESAHEMHSNAFAREPVTDSFSLTSAEEPGRCSSASISSLPDLNVFMISPRNGNNVELSSSAATVSSPSIKLSLSDDSPDEVYGRVSNQTESPNSTGNTTPQRRTSLVSGEFSDRTRRRSIVDLTPFMEPRKSIVELTPAMQARISVFETLPDSKECQDQTNSASILYNEDKKSPVIEVPKMERRRSIREDVLELERRYLREDEGSDLSYRRTSRINNPQMERRKSVKEEILHFERQVAQTEKKQDSQRSSSKDGAIQNRRTSIGSNYSVSDEDVQNDAFGLESHKSLKKKILDIERRKSTQEQAPVYENETAWISNDGSRQDVKLVSESQVEASANSHIENLEITDDEYLKSVAPYLKYRKSISELEPYLHYQNEALQLSTSLREQLAMNENSLGKREVIRQDEEEENGNESKSDSNSDLEREWIVNETAPNLRYEKCISDIIPDTVVKKSQGIKDDTDSNPTLIEYKRNYNPEHDTSSNESSRRASRTLLGQIYISSKNSTSKETSDANSSMVLNENYSSIASDLPIESQLGERDSLLHTSKGMEAQSTSAAIESGQPESENDPREEINLVRDEIEHNQPRKSFETDFRGLLGKRLGNTSVMDFEGESAEPFHNNDEGSVVTGVSQRVLVLFEDSHDASGESVTHEDSGGNSNEISYEGANYNSDQNGSTSQTNMNSLSPNTIPEHAQKRNSIGLEVLNFISRRLSFINTTEDSNVISSLEVDNIYSRVSDDAFESPRGSVISRMNKFPNESITLDDPEEVLSTNETHTAQRESFSKYAVPEYVDFSIFPDEASKSPRRSFTIEAFNSSPRSTGSTDVTQSTLQDTEFSNIDQISTGSSRSVSDEPRTYNRGSISLDENITAVNKSQSFEINDTSPKGSLDIITNYNTTYEPPVQNSEIAYRMDAQLPGSPIETDGELASENDKRRKSFSVEVLDFITRRLSGIPSDTSVNRDDVEQSETPRGSVQLEVKDSPRGSISYNSKYSTEYSAVTDTEQPQRKSSTEGNTATQTIKSNVGEDSNVYLKEPEGYSTDENNIRRKSIGLEVLEFISRRISVDQNLSTGNISGETTTSDDQETYLSKEADYISPRELLLSDEMREPGSQNISVFPRDPKSTRSSKGSINLDDETHKDVLYVESSRGFAYVSESENGTAMRKSPTSFSDIPEIRYPSSEDEDKHCQGQYQEKALGSKRKSFGMEEEDFSSKSFSTSDMAENAYGEPNGDNQNESQHNEVYSSQNSSHELTTRGDVDAPCKDMLSIDENTISSQDTIIQYDQRRKSVSLDALDVMVRKFSSEPIPDHQSKPNDMLGETLDSPLNYTASPRYSIPEQDSNVQGQIETNKNDLRRQSIGMDILNFFVRRLSSGAQGQSEQDNQEPTGSRISPMSSLSTDYSLYDIHQTLPQESILAEESHRSERGSFVTGEGQSSRKGSIAGEQKDPKSHRESLVTEQYYDRSRRASEEKYRRSSRSSLVTDEKDHEVSKESRIDDDHSLVIERSGRSSKGSLMDEDDYGFPSRSLIADEDRTLHRQSLVIEKPSRSRTGSTSEETNRSRKGSQVVEQDYRSQRQSLKADDDFRSPRGSLVIEQDNRSRTGSTLEQRQISRDGTQLVEDDYHSYEETLSANDDKKSYRGSVSENDHISRKGTLLVEENLGSHHGSRRGSLAAQDNHGSRRGSLVIEQSSRSRSGSTSGQYQRSRGASLSAEDDRKSHRGSVSENDQRSKRGSLVPEKDLGSHRGSLVSEEDRGFLTAEDNHGSRRGSLVIEQSSRSRSGSTSEQYQRSRGASLSAEDDRKSHRGSVSENDQRSKRGSLVPEKDLGSHRGSLVSEEDRGFLTAEDNHGSRRGSLVIEQSSRSRSGSTSEQYQRSRGASLSAEDDRKSHRGSVSENDQRSKRGSLVPEKDLGSHRGSLVSEEDRGFLTAEDNHGSRRGSLVIEQSSRSRSGSTSEQYQRSRGASLSAEDDRKSHRGSVSENDQRSKRGSLVPEKDLGSHRGSLVLEEDRGFLTAEDNHGSRRGSLVIEQSSRSRSGSTSEQYQRSRGASLSAEDDHKSHMGSVSENDQRSKRGSLVPEKDLGSHRGSLVFEEDRGVLTAEDNHGSRRGSLVIEQSSRSRSGSTSEEYKRSRRGSEGMGEDSRFHGDSLLANDNGRSYRGSIVIEHPSRSRSGSTSEQVQRSRRGSDVVKQDSGSHRSMSMVDDDHMPHRETLVTEEYGRSRKSSMSEQDQRSRRGSEVREYDSGDHRVSLVANDVRGSKRSSLVTEQPSRSRKGSVSERDQRSRRGSEVVEIDSEPHTASLMANDARKSQRGSLVIAEDSRPITDDDHKSPSRSRSMSTSGQNQRSRRGSEVMEEVTGGHAASLGADEDRRSHRGSRKASAAEENRTFGEGLAMADGDYESHIRSVSVDNYHSSRKKSFSQENRVSCRDSSIEKERKSSRGSEAADDHHGYQLGSLSPDDDQTASRGSLVTDEDRISHKGPTAEKDSRLIRGALVVEEDQRSQWGSLPGVTDADHAYHRRSIPQEEELLARQQDQGSNWGSIMGSRGDGVELKRYSERSNSEETPEMTDFGTESDSGSELDIDWTLNEIESENQSPATVIENQVRLQRFSPQNQMPIAEDHPEIHSEVPDLYEALYGHIITILTLPELGGEDHEVRATFVPDVTLESEITDSEWMAMSQLSQNISGFTTSKITTMPAISPNDSSGGWTTMDALQIDKKKPLDSITTVTFCGCGFLGVYLVGAATYLQEHVPQLLRGRLAGSSVGSLIAACIACDIPLELVRKNILATAEISQNYLLGPFNPFFPIEEPLLKNLLKMIPQDGHIRASGRLFLSLTRATTLTNEIVSEYSSREELIRALLCCCFLPFISGFTVPTFKGRKYIDGGMSNNMPLKGSKTLSINAFSGDFDICPEDPVDDDRPLASGFNQSIKMTNNNLVKLFQALLPPKPEELDKYYHLGYSDAQKCFPSEEMRNL